MMKVSQLPTRALTPSILYVEDEIGEFNNFRRRIRELWPKAHVTHAEDFSAKAVTRELAAAARDGHPVDAILLDLHHEDDDELGEPISMWAGIRLLQKLRSADSPAHRLPIIACTKYGDRHPGTQARNPGVVFLAHGGTDFIEKTEIFKRFADVSWHHRLRTHVLMARRVYPQGEGAPLVPAVRGTLEGAGVFINKLRAQIERFVSNGTRFLCLHGETGVGKGKAVGYVKSLLELTDEQTAEIQLSTVPETLLEPYLFGHRKGAFTGANLTGIGALEGKALIYLDEFQRVPLHVQSKLLRVLRERKYHRVGEPHVWRTIPQDAVFVVSLDAPPDVLVRRGVLAPDIAGRLPLSVIELLPLRARKDEIERLVRIFLDRRRARSQTTRGRTARALEIDPEGLRLISQCAFDWPYNIGQLEAFVEHLCDTRTTNLITPADVQRALTRLMGSELELALRLFRRYAFDRTLAAKAWDYLGRPGTTYLRHDRNMNTFSIRRLIARVAVDVSHAYDAYEDRLMSDLLGPERFDPMLQSIVRREILDLQARVAASINAATLQQLMQAAPERPWKRLLHQRALGRPDPNQDRAARGGPSLAKLFDYTAIRHDLRPGIGLLLALDRARLERFNPFSEHDGP